MNLYVNNKENCSHRIQQREEILYFRGEKCLGGKMGVKLQKSTYYVNSSLYILFESIRISNCTSTKKPIAKSYLVYFFVMNFKILNLVS
jgi:hypothetical protein